MYSDRDNNIDDVCRNVFQIFYNIPLFSYPVSQKYISMQIRWYAKRYL